MRGICKGTDNRPPSTTDAGGLPEVYQDMEEDILLALDFSTGNTEESLEAMLNEVKQATVRTAAGISAAKAARREGREAKRNIKKQPRGNAKTHLASETTSKRDADNLAKKESPKLQDVVVNKGAVVKESLQGAKAPEDDKTAAVSEEHTAETIKAQPEAIDGPIASSTNIVIPHPVDVATDKAESANDNVGVPGKSTKGAKPVTVSGGSKDAVTVKGNNPAASKKSLQEANLTETTHLNLSEAAKESDDKARAQFGSDETGVLAEANISVSNLSTEGAETHVLEGTPSIHNRDAAPDLPLTESGPKRAPALTTDPAVQPLHSKGGSISAREIEGGPITESSGGSTLEISRSTDTAAPAQETPGSPHVTIEEAIKDKPLNSHASVDDGVLVGSESCKKTEACSDLEPPSAKADAITGGTDARNITTETATEGSVHSKSPVQGTDASKSVSATNLKQVTGLSDRSVATDSHVSPTIRSEQNTTMEPSMKTIEKVPTAESKGSLEKVARNQTAVPKSAPVASSGSGSAEDNTTVASAKPNRESREADPEDKTASSGLGTLPPIEVPGLESGKSNKPNATGTPAAGPVADGATVGKPSTLMPPQALSTTLQNASADGSAALGEKTNAVTDVTEDGARDDVFHPKGKKSDDAPKSGFSSNPSAEPNHDVLGHKETRNDQGARACSGPTTEELSSCKQTESASAVSDSPKFQQKGTADADETGNLLLTEKVPAVKGPDALVGQKSSKNHPAKEPGMSHARTSSPTAGAASKTSPLSPRPNSPKLSAAHPNSAEPAAAPAAKHDITKEIDDFMLELGLTDDSATKLLATLDAESSRDLRGKPVYLLTSLAGGGFHMPSRTNRLATILTANQIDFQYRDCGSDDAARTHWKRQGRGRSLPAIMVGDAVVGNWHEFDEANEEWKVRQLCGL